MARPAKPPVLYRVREPFAATVKGVRQVFTVGPQVYTEDHPAVSQCPMYFEAATPMETATAEPGELRSVRLPAKKAAAKADEKPTPKQEETQS